MRSWARRSRLGSIRSAGHEPARTPQEVRSRGTAAVVAAMTERGVRRLVVQSSYGVGESRDRLSLSSRLVFALLLRPQIADHERQERIVRDSGLTWSIVQPVYLTDGDEPAVLSDTGDVAGMRLSGGPWVRSSPTWPRRPGTPGGASRCRGPLRGLVAALPGPPGACRGCQQSPAPSLRGVPRRVALCRAPPRARERWGQGVLLGSGDARGDRQWTRWPRGARVG